MTENDDDLNYNVVADEKRIENELYGKVEDVGENKGNISMDQVGKPSNFGKFTAGSGRGETIEGFKHLNQSITVEAMHDKIKRNLENDEEEDENNDADPESLNPRGEDDDLNKTIGDIFTLQMFGRRDPKEKMQPFDTSRASLVERMLHPMYYGSLRGSVLALTTMCMDATSALVLATRCKDLGVINFCLLIILGGFIANRTLNFMAKSAKSLSERDYSRVVKLILGKNAGVFLDCIISLFVFGVEISFQVIIYSLIGRIYYEIFLGIYVDKDKYKTFDDFKLDVWDKAIIKFPVMYCVALLAMPFCLLKDVSKMKYASLFGILALAYTIIVLIAQCPFYVMDFLKTHSIKDMNWIDIRGSFKRENNFSFFGGVATVFYLYSCHQGAFPVYKTLHNNTTRRIKKVFRNSILLDICLFCTSAFVSFLTTPLDPDDLIVYRKSIFTHDYFMLIARVGIVINLYFSIPINYSALRISILELVFGDTNLTTVKNISITLFVLFITSSIGALYADILAYIALLGGFSSVIYCYLMPGLMYVASRKEKIKICSPGSIGIILLVGTITFLGYTSGVITIILEMILKK